MKLEAFFPPGTPVVALPSWERPRLLVAAWSVTTRWTGSALYPAYRWPAKGFRLLLRLRCAMASHTTRRTQGPWLMETFLREAGMDDAEPSAVLLAMGLSRTRALGAVRLSLGRWTTEAEVDRAAEALVAAGRAALQAARPA